MLTNPRLRWGLIKDFGVRDIALLYGCFSVDAFRSIKGLTALVYNPGKQSGLNGQTTCVNHHTSMHRFGLGFIIRGDRRGGGEKKGSELSGERQLHGSFNC